MHIINTMSPLAFNMKGAFPSLLPVDVEREPGRLSPA